MQFPYFLFEPVLCLVGRNDQLYPLISYGPSVVWGNRGSTVAKVLCYKSEGR